MTAIAVLRLLKTYRKDLSPSRLSLEEVLRDRYLASLLLLASAQPIVLFEDDGKPLPARISEAYNISQLVLRQGLPLDLYRLARSTIGRLRSLAYDITLEYSIARVPLAVIEGKSGFPLYFILACRGCWHREEQLGDSLLVVEAGYEDVYLRQEIPLSLKQGFVERRIEKLLGLLRGLDTRRP